MSQSVQTSLCKETIVRRNERNFLVSRIGEEVVLMDIHNGQYIGLNAVGSAIWEKLEQPVAIHDVVNALMQEYAISMQLCEQETLLFLQKMMQHRMLIVD
ncbi:Coenzyme PQQ synthesis protein D (PqqD) [Chitinophaga sp. YR627]|uniref:PqqD family peptide modification chaperone n=1 Tax=Chitinophaga sp. YR627 TaxID=1881041 RepID=UPI0008E9B89D|nr:PqqD family peptide modification chaperone [Chitinophaga sp. YR627]SFM70076.1 Coenzyme PQQ synthesis protein D (PqqD) [Chitinophaga sp. YR627]